MASARSPMAIRTAPGRFSVLVVAALAVGACRGREPPARRQPAVETAPPAPAAESLAAPPDTTRGDSVMARDTIP